MKNILFLITLFCAFSIQLSAQSPFHAQKASLTFETPGEAVATWEASTHNFGEVEQGTPVSYTFSFTNTGNKALTIDKVKVGCGCTATAYSEEAIAPGESGFVTATYNAVKTGHFTKTVTVFTNEATQQKQLVLKGEVTISEE